MRITFYSIVFTCIIETCLIGLFAILIKNKHLYKFYNLDLLNTVFFILIFKLCFPVEIGLISIFKPSNLINTIQSNTSTNKFILYLYLIGVVIAILIYVLKIRKTNKIYKLILNSPYTKMNNTSKYPIISSALISTPMVILWHKIIFIPDLNYSKDELDYIIMHENKHIEAKDIWIKFLLLCISIVYWWFIPIYYLKYLTNIYLELRIDHIICNNLEENDQYNYLETLVSISKKLNTNLYNHLSFISSFTSNLTYRVNYCLSSKKSKTNRIILICIIIFAFVNVIFTFENKVNITNNKKHTIQYEFPNLDETDKVLQLPGGGWLYGEAEISSGGFFRKIIKYNSQNDPNAITIKQYLKQK